MGPVSLSERYIFQVDTDSGKGENGVDEGVRSREYVSGTQFETISSCIKIVCNFY